MRAQGDVAGHWHRRQGSRGEAFESGAASAGENLARLLSGELLGVVGRTVGLDAIRLEQEAQRRDIFDDPTLISGDVDPAARLTLAKRLGSNVELVFSQNLADEGFTWITSYFGPFGLSWRLLVLDDQSRSYDSGTSCRSARDEPGSGRGRRRRASRRSGSRGLPAFRRTSCGRSSGSPRAIDSRSARGSATAIASSASITIRVFSRRDPRPRLPGESSGQSQDEPRPRRGWSSNTGSPAAPRLSSSSAAPRSRTTSAIASSNDGRPPCSTAFSSGMRGRSCGSTSTGRDT